MIVALASLALIKLSLTFHKTPCLSGDEEPPGGPGLLCRLRIPSQVQVWVEGLRVGAGQSEVRDQSSDL